MGRQIPFHMLPEDRDAFLRFAQEADPVWVVARDSKTREVEPITNFEIGPNVTLCLWNRKVLSHVDRSWIPDPGYYRLDSLHMPLLEFMPSFSASWEGKAALGQGRLFGNFEPHLRKPDNFEEWYEILVRWIRRNYRRNPTVRSYVGPAAYQFYEGGGYLLPSFVPPRTNEWVAEIAKQRSTGPSRRRAPDAGATRRPKGNSGADGT